MHSYMKMYPFTRVSTITKYCTAVDKKEPTVRRERPSFSRLLCSPGSPPPPYTHSQDTVSPRHTHRRRRSALRRAPAAVWPLSDGHRQLFGRQSEDLLGLEPPVSDVLADLTPGGPVARLGGHAPLHHLTLLLLRAVLLLKLQVVGPRVAQVRLHLQRPVEPVTSLLQLPLGPEQPVRATRGGGR